MAVISGSDEVLRCLLETENEIFAECDDVWDAFQMATRERRRDLARTLLYWGRKMNIEDNYPEPYRRWILLDVDEMLPIFMGDISFEQAIAHKWEATLNAIIDEDLNKVSQSVTTIPINFVSNSGTLLTTAAKVGKVDMVQLLLSKGARIVTKDCEGNSALENAAAGGHDEVVKLLLEEGANVNEETGPLSDGTALQCAATNGHLSIVQLLLERSARVEKQGLGPGNKETALIRAARSNSEATAILLVEHGADVLTRSLSGKTVLHLAAKHVKGNC